MRVCTWGVCEVGGPEALEGKADLWGAIQHWAGWGACIHPAGEVAFWPVLKVRGPVRADRGALPRKVQKCGGATHSRARGWAGECEGPSWGRRWSWRGGTWGEGLHSRLHGAKCCRKPASPSLSPVVGEGGRMPGTLVPAQEVVVGLQRCAVGFIAPWHAGSSRTGDRTRVPALAGGFSSTVPPGAVHNGNS